MIFRKSCNRTLCRNAQQFMMSLMLYVHAFCHIIATLTHTFVQQFMLPQENKISQTLCNENVTQYQYVHKFPATSLVALRA